MDLKWQFNRAVRASRTLSPGQRLLLLTLSDRADLDGTIPEEHTPNQDLLAAETGLSLRSVRNFTREMEEAGWLELRRPTGKLLARYRRIGYRLCIPTGAATGAPTSGPAVDAAPEVPAPTAPSAPVQGGKMEQVSPAEAAPPMNTTKNNQPPYPPADAPAAAPAARLRREGGAKRNDPPAPNPADAVLAKLHPQLEHEHVGRWTRARWRKQLTQALADGWKEPDLIRELTKDIGNARSVAGVIDFRLKNLAAPPKPTWTPPAYEPEPVHVVHEQAKRAVIAEARAVMARARERRLAATC